MAIYDVTAAGATTEIGKVHDFTASGTSAAIKTVYDVTAAGATSIIYEDEMLLYDAGVAYVPFSNGTGNQAANGLSFENNRMFLFAVSQTGNNEWNGAGTTNTVDLTPYNRLSIVTQGVTDPYYGAGLGIYTGRSFYSNATVVQEQYGTFGTTHTFDISAKNGQFYIGFKISGGYYGHGYLYVYQIKLFNE